MKTCFAFCLGLLALVGFLPQARAGNACGLPAYYPTTTYAAPQVQYQTQYVDRVQYVDRIVPVAYPVPFTVAVPVVSYLYNGGTYAPTFAAQPSMQMPPVQAAPQAVTAPASSPGQFTDAQIDMLIERIEKRLAARAPKPEAPAVMPSSVGRFSSSPPPVAPYDAVAILRVPRGAEHKSCASCHGGSNFKKVKFFDDAGNFIASPAVKQRIYNRAFEGTMPPAAETDPSALLSDAEVEKLQTSWGLQPHQ